LFLEKKNVYIKVHTINEMMKETIIAISAAYCETLPKADSKNSRMQ
jgi:hypothetical protein